MTVVRSRFPPVTSYNGFDTDFITRQGKPAAVIIGLEYYLEVQDALNELSDPAYLRELLAAREEILQGKGIPAEEVFRQKGV